MNTCENVRDQFLDHLYGLLDRDESAALEGHLGSCEACRSALAAAQGQRQALAVAARASFPAVRFEPPAAPVVPQEPASVRLIAPAGPRRSWRRLAVAAGLFLALAGLAAAAGLSWNSRRQDLLLAKARLHDVEADQRVVMQTNQAEALRSQQEIRAVQDEIMKMEQSWKEETEKTRKAAAEKQLQVIVSGPKTVEAGARNEYRIETRRPTPQGNGPQAPSQVKARVVDRNTRAVLFNQELASAGNCLLVLPRDLPVKPGAQLALEVTARDPRGVEAQVTEQLPLLGTLYLTHLTTDRPMYRPGEVVRFRSLTLERFSLRPAQEDFALRYVITNPTGAEVFKLEGKSVLTAGRGQPPLRGPDGKELRGLGAGEFLIPPGAAGGEYTLAVSDAAGRFPPERRKFLVNQYQAPRLNKELEFTRKFYGPGDVVEAACKVAKVDGGKPVANQPVSATATVDGRPVAVENAGRLRTNDRGEVVPPIRFRLPAGIDRGQGSLTVQLTDGANRESIVRPIPIVLKKLYVDFYPEGGDLVAGVANRVYFQVRTTLNKPAELHGRVVDQDGRPITAVQTLSDDKELGVNQGMGRFQITPEAGKTYELKIDQPIGIDGRYVLPQARADGVVLTIPNGVVTDRIDVRLQTGRTERNLLVGAYCRGRVLDHVRTTVKPGAETSVTLKPVEPAGGVCRITVFEERPGAGPVQLVPVAERLIYRQPAERLDLGIRTDKKSYSPGAPVTLSFTATSEKDRPASAVLLVSVVDQSIIKLADDKTARSMPAHFFLTTEVKKPEDLEYADFLLSDHPKAAAALDLLLGTQGWRRFAEQDPALFRRQQKQEADRLLLVSGRSTPALHDSVQASLARVELKYAPVYELKQKDLARKEAEERELPQRGQEKLNRAATAITAAWHDAESASAGYREFTRRLVQGGLGLLVLLLVLVGVIGVVKGLTRLAQSRKRGVPYLLSGLRSLALLFLGGSVVLLNQLGGARQASPLWGRRADPGEIAMAPNAAPDRGGAAVEGRELEKLEEKANKEPTFDDKGGGDKLRERLDPLQRAQAETAPALPLRNAGPEPTAPVPPPDAAKADTAKDVAEARLGQLPVPAEQPAPPPAQLAELARMKEAPEQQGPALRAQLEDAPRVRAGARGMAGPAGGPVAAMGDIRLDPARAEQLLRQQGRFREIAQRRLHLQQLQAPSPEPLVVREYAHRHLPAADGVRRDFAETVCWQPALILPDGKAQVGFELPDSVTRFEVVAWGHTLDGRLGAATTEFASRLPFSLEPKGPTEITHTDKVVIPVTVANDTSTARSVQLQVKAAGLRLEGADQLQLAVGAEQRLRKLFTFHPLAAEGQARVAFAGRCDPFGVDAVERSFKVVPEGFPVVGSQSDLLEGTVRADITLPATWVKGTLKLQAQVFPSTLADLQKGLEAMLREPGGCFEQTSSSNYPNVLILNYLKESDQARPEIEQRARQLLDSGYRQLTSFECIDPRDGGKRRGYEWFGRTAPPHEALTAYGLLEFHDMGRVHAVDQAMVGRTRQYLLGQRDGKGGFKRNPNAVDTFGRAPLHITNAYIVWALTEAGTPDKLDTELNALAEQARGSKDPYFLALVGNSLVGRGRAEEGVAVLKKLAGLQQADGHLQGTETSITCSGGRDLQIETTALATLAWLKVNRPADFNSNVQKAVQWLGRQRGGFGGFGSTQSTILALKALIAFTRDHRKTAEAGTLKLFVNDRAEPVATKDFAAGTQETLVLSLPDAKVLRPGKNTVRVEMTGRNAFPYTLTWSYSTLKPANAEDCPVRLTADLDRRQASEGDPVRLTATVENRSGKGQGMAVAILGLPGGLALPEDMKQLKEMARLRDNDTKPGLISAWEVRGRELVLYWRDLAPDQKIEVSVDLICRIPGEYSGPASRAYLYYNADRKFWAEPLHIAIRPGGE